MTLGEFRKITKDYPDDYTILAGDNWYDLMPVYKIIKSVDNNSIILDTDYETNN